MKLVYFFLFLFIRCIDVGHTDTSGESDSENDNYGSNNQQVIIMKPNLQ